MGLEEKKKYKQTNNQTNKNGASVIISCDSSISLPRHQAVNVVPEETGALIQAGVRDPDDLSRPVQPGLAHGGLRWFSTLHVGGNDLVGRLGAGFRVDVHHLGLHGWGGAQQRYKNEKMQNPRMKN